MFANKLRHTCKVFNNLPFYQYKSHIETHNRHINEHKSLTYIKVIKQLNELSHLIIKISQKLTKYGTTHTHTHRLNKQTGKIKY